MTTLLPKDADNNPIPALRLRDGGAHSLSAGVTPNSNTTAFNTDTKVIGLYATVPVFIKFGDAGVTATASDHYFPAGVYYDIALGGGGTKGSHQAYISVLRAEEDGNIYISEKE